MFEIPFFTSTSSRFNEDSFDTGHVDFSPDEDNMYGYLPKHIVKNDFPTKQPVISGEENAFSTPKPVHSFYHPDADGPLLELGNPSPPPSVSEPISTNYLVPVSTATPIVQFPDSCPDPDYISYDQPTSNFPSTAINPLYDSDYRRFNFSESSFDSSIHIENNFLNIEETTYDTVAHIESNMLSIEEEVVNTTANIVSNVLNVDEFTVETTANVVSNVLNVDELTVETTANVVSNVLVVDESTVSTTAVIESNQLDIKENTISTPVNLESNRLQVNEVTINSSANIESNQLLINEHTTLVPVNIESNRINVTRHTTTNPVSLESNHIEVNEKVLENVVDVESNRILINEKSFESQATVESNKILINEKSYESQATVESNSIQIIDKQIDTPVVLSHNNIIVSENTINTPVQIENNNLQVVNKVIETPTEIVSNKLLVNTEVVDTVANIASNNLLINEETVNSQANIRSNDLLINEETVNTQANIRSNFLLVNEETVNTQADIRSNNLIINDQVYDTHVNLNSNNLSINEQVIDTQANIFSNNLHVQDNVIDTPVFIESNSLSVIENTIPTRANIYSNSLDIDQTTINSTATVENHKVNIIEKVHESNVIVPKFVVNVIEHETPINISTNDLLSKIIDKFVDSNVPNPCIKTSNPCQLTASSNSSSQSISRPYPSLVLSSPSFYSSGVDGVCKGSENIASKSVALQASNSSSLEVIDGSQSLDSPSIASPNTNVSPNHSSDFSDASEGNRHHHNDRDPPDHSLRNIVDDIDQFTPEALRRDLMSVDDMKDLRRVRSKWNGKNVNDTLFGANNDVEDNPIMWNVVLSRVWPEVGMFVCPECLTFADDVNINFRNHVSRVHHSYPIDSSHNAVIAAITGRSHIWRLQKEGNEDVIIESVYTCPIDGCKYFSNDRGNFLSHLRSHKHLKDCVSRFGFFWGPIIHGASIDRMLKATDIFKDREGFGCPFCDSYFTSSSCGFTQHLNKMHKGNHRVEGATVPKPVRVKLKTLIHKEIVDDEMNELERSKERQLESNIQPAAAPSVPNVCTNNNSTDVEANEDIDVLDINDSVVSNSSSVTNNDPISSNVNSSTDVTEIASLSNTSQNVEMEEEYEIPEHERSDLLIKARKWLMKCEEEEINGVSLPRLMKKQRMRVMEPLRRLFDSKIKDLIKYIRISNSDEDDWLISQGILARISLLIRKTIRTSLRIPMNNTKKKKVRNRDIQYNRSTISIKKIFELSELCDLIEKLIELSDDRSTAAKRNAIANIEKNIVDCIKQTDEGVVQELFGGKELNNIKRFISDSAEHREMKLEWLRSRILKEEKNYELIRGRKHESTVRDFYNEDATRCANWFICGSMSPECKVSIESFENHFRNEWKQASCYRSGSPLLQTGRFINDDTQDWFLQRLYDVDAIKKVISRKSNMSAAGPDAISNVVWKSDVDTSSKLISRLLKAMMTIGRIPDAWRRSKTVVIYKKGASDDVKSWRPISLTPTLYRIVLGHVANVVQELNAKCSFFCTAQKGFIHNVNGASEHINVLNELISDATRNRKDINILTLDFANAFGSIDHRHIVDTLKEVGFPTCFCKWIKDLYTNTTTSFSVNGEIGQPVPMDRGVRQGCPFSPILFNLCLEPLLRNIMSNRERDGYFVKDLSFTVQAFADDVVLISHSSDGLRNMLQTVDDFCHATGMNLTAAKCNWLSYIMRDGRRVASSDKLTINDESISAQNIDDYIKYLGAPIATNRDSKMKFSSEYLRSVKHDINQILLSPLKFAQSLDAIRRLIIPKLDFIFLNGVVSIKEAKKLDESIRAMIQKKIKSPGLPIEIVHMSWRDGGMNIPRLEDRFELLQVRNFIGLLSSKDYKVRKLFKLGMKAEISKRKIQPCDKNSFLGFNKSNDTNYNLKTNTSFIRALNATKKLKFSIETPAPENDNDYNFLDDTSVPLFTLKFDDSEDDSKTVNSKNFLQTINKSMKCIYQNDLLKKDFRAHSFSAIKNSPLSNFFIGNYKSSVTDNIVKFAFQARSNSLLTEEVEHKRYNTSDRCKACGGTMLGSLMHHLNKCNASMTSITKRHNEIAHIITDGIRNMLRFDTPPLNENSTVFIPDEPQLPDRSSRFKPDIWFFTTDAHTLKKTVTIIEITCPYAMDTDTPTGRKSSLDIRREDKLKKYEPLVDDIKSTWNADVSLHVIVVSSLGAITTDTEKELMKIFKTKNRANNIAKRCVVAAIKGSWSIFFDKNIDHSHNNTSHTVPSDANNITSSSHLTDEEDGDILN